MRRAVCLSQPSLALAGQANNWRFSYSSPSILPAKTLVKFDLASSGQDHEWELPQTEGKSKKTQIWLEMPSKKIVPGMAVTEQPGQFEFVLPESIEQGQTIVISLGSNEGKVEGIKAQKYVERRRPFLLYLDPKGKREYKEPETFLIDVKGNALKNILIVAPSLVFKNHRFDVVVRFEDHYGNLTGRVPEGTLIELYYDQLRENLKWKLFCPETGFITLPNLYLNEPGLYILKLKNMTTGEVFQSTPIVCAQEGTEFLFWGQLHGESLRFNSGLEVESTLRYFRDDRSLQFFSTSSPEAEELMPVDTWKLINSCINEFNEEERFVAMEGVHWFSPEPEEGCRQLIFSKNNRPLVRKKETKWSTLKRIYKNHTPKELISIPCITSLKGYSCNFSDFHPEFERVVEIYNAWGSSECLAKEGNERPYTSLTKKRILQEEAEGTILHALNRNCRFGFVAGGYDRRGVYANFIDKELMEYTPGHTAIFAPVHSRDALFQALYQRRCYATTGEHILLSFNIAGQPMGTEISTVQKPGLLYTRFISGYVAGTDMIEKIFIYRNGKIFKEITPEQQHYVTLEIEDNDPHEKITLKSKNDDRPPFLYYYLKVVQKNGSMAWGSPIWIDFVKEKGDKAESIIKRIKKKS